MAAQIAPRRMEYPRIGDFRRVVPPGLKEIGDTPMMNASEGCGSGRQGSQSASRRGGPKHPLRRVRGAEALPHGHVAEKELRHASASPCGAAAQLELPTSDRFGRRQSIGGSGGVCRSAEGHGRWRRLRPNGGSVGLGPHGSVSRSTVRVVSVAGAGHTRRTICKITQAGPRPRGAGSVFSAPTPWRCAISRRALQATRPRDHPAAGSTNRSALLASAAPRAAGLKDSVDLPMMMVSDGCGARTAGTPIEPRFIGVQAGPGREPKRSTMTFHGASAERELWRRTTSQCGTTSRKELSTGDRGDRRELS